MEIPSIVQVESLINQLYSSNDPTTTKQIQDQLQSLQKQPFAWEIAAQLLSLQSNQCRFFGAHTFQIKITRDWDTLPEDRVDWLRDELLRSTVQLCGGPAFVTTKLCLALIAFAFQTVPDKWPQFIPSTIETLRMGAQAYQVPLETINLAILEFCTLVPEEVSNSNLLGGRKLQLIGELKESIPLVLSHISNLLFSEVGPTVQQKTLRCLQSWIQYGFNLEDAYPILRKVMTFLGNPDLFESSVEVLSESMQQASWAKYQNYRDELLACFTSQDMKDKMNACIADEDEETAKLLAKLFTSFGEAYTDYVATQLAEPNINSLLSMILQLSGFEGFFPVDQEVSDIPLNFWYILQETLFDENVLPAKDSCGETALILYRELVKILMRNACYPDENTWNSWSKDAQDKFRTWRRDLGDTMINPYYILRDELLAILLDHSIHILNQWASLPTAPQLLEATLFCLSSVSEEIKPDENMHIHRFFGSEVLGRLPDNCGARLKNTTLLLMGSLAEWLKVNPQYLGNVMNYIVPCLSDPQLAFSASSAFASICDTCRNSLVGELNNLMHVYVAMSNSNIKSNIMQKVVESVADVIQVLPPEQAMSPLMSLTGDILQGISKAFENMEKDPEGSREASLMLLQYLSACCRGIQSPNDDYQSLSERNSVYDAFASGQLTALYVNVDGFSQVTYAIRESACQIARTWGSNEQIAKALCTFLDQGMRSTSPLLSLTFLDLAALIESSYSAAPYSCWLNTASFMMTVYGGQNMCLERLRDLLGSLTTKTLEFINGAEAMDHYPDIVDSYFNLLSKTITRCNLAFYHLPPTMINTIFLFTIVGMGLQERLALKAALNFTADFVSQDYDENSEIKKIVDSIIMNMGYQIMEQLLLGIGGRVPRSFSGPLIDVLYKITGKYLQPSREWMHTLLATDGFPSNLVDSKDKEAFVKGVLGTRSLKRFKEATNTFSIKCRGLGNTSFGKV